MKRPALEAVAQIQWTLREPVVTGNIGLSGVVFKGVELREAGARFSFRDRIIRRGAGARWWGCS